MSFGVLRNKLKDDFEGRKRVYLMGEMTEEHYQGLKEMYEATLKLLVETEKTQRENAKSFCWAIRPDKNPQPCDKMSCCYNASSKSVFDYWKFANSKEWKKIVAQELAKEKLLGKNKP